LGLVTSDHVPFCKVSTRVLAMLLLSSEDPTAVHALAERQEMPDKELSFVPLFGLVTIDHEAPFQDSTSVSRTPLGLRWEPTAVQTVAELHETPASLLWPAFGLDTVDQVVPFQDTTSVESPPKTL
jgi:hypothetical protein